MSEITISCPLCLATNRIPESRIGDNPRCGKCKKALFLGDVMELSSSNLSATIRNNQIPVLVDCWAPWCGPCRSFAPIFKQAAQTFEPNLRFAKLNTEQNPAVSQQWNIRSIPTLILFKQGRELSRVSGALSMSQLTQWLSQNSVIK